MRTFLIDTDTAADDAMALTMALQQPDVRVVAVTINCGNTPFDQQVRNALYTVELAGKADEVPVYAGCREPLQKRFRNVPEVFGADGMSDANLPAPKATAAPEHAVDTIIDAAQRYAGQLEIVALAPLTNIAVAITRAPEIVPLIKTVYFMGGTLHAVGNITMGAEFNVWVDPEAADIVFRSGVRLVVTPWETARNHAVMTVVDREAIAQFKTPTADFFYKVTRALYEYTQQVEGKPGGIHSDIIGMTVPLFPDETLDQADMYMAVELGGELSRGVTFLDWVGLTGKPPNVTIVKAIDSSAFRQHIIDMCRRV